MREQLKTIDALKTGAHLIDRAGDELLAEVYKIIVLIIWGSID